MVPRSTTGQRFGALVIVNNHPILSRLRPRDRNILIAMALKCARGAHADGLKGSHVAMTPLPSRCHDGSWPSLAIAC